MTKQELFAEMEEVLELDTGALSEEHKLEDLEMWDSLAVVTFIALIDEHLELTLEPEKIAQAQTVSDLVALVQGSLAG